MGVESDRLVFDYLSRVGDLAQTAMPAAERMQLVAQLRNDIDRQRDGTSGDSPAAVRRILGRIGTPDEVVEAASGSGEGSGSRSGAGSGSGSRSGAGSGSGPGEPPAGSYGPYAKRGPQVPVGRSGADGGRGGSGGTKPGDGTGTTGPARGRGRDRDRDGLEWWQGSPRGGGPLRAGEELAGLPGMTGGVFIPVDDEELDEEDPPPSTRRRAGAAPAAVEEEPAGGAAYEEEAPAGRQRRPLLPALRRVRSGWGSPSLLLAALLLLGGAALGSLIPLGLGWLLAYLSRAMSRTQAKFAVLGIPGAAAAAMVVWVWGRDVGKWGKPIAQGQVGHAFQDVYPVTIRLAAVGTALYLLWRSRRSA
ncbi:hypothetical protein SAMN05216267_1001121 [Actinacidiphila rubida]|uniref:Uncharacterized protein n=1 Tax=Actinacidiphila rubida TaxID=310780 RepID=A0A1H8DIC2_9ACTN|nr:hypothetical protein [Actinacidiphila rubida]SEN06906.1 hypothetical protein SAMN05216267_1001121 [Actinacidiphila rubida]